MKHKLLSCVSVGISAAVFCASAIADQTADAIKHVYVTVGPDISVGVVDSNVGLPAVQLGTITADLDFRVDCNQEAVTLGVATTALYKGDDPTNNAVPPLKVDQTLGATITPTHATPMQGASNVAQYNSTAVTYNGFSAFRTNDIPFESSQNGHFSQDVNVHVGWQQTNPEQPQGEYSGYVVLYAAILGN